MVISIPGQDDIIIEDCKVSRIEIPNLENNSEYHLTILVYGKYGGVTTIRISGTTKDSPENKAPDASAESPIKKKYPRLKGYEWNS